MTIKEIIDGLKFTVEMFLFDPRTGETFTEPRNDMDKTTIDACNGAIELLEQEPKTEWIPVSEPPKELGTYLIQTDGEPYMCQCRWTDVNPFWTDYKTKPHWNIFDLPQYSKVVAWMPLPKPYLPDINIGNMSEEPTGSESEVRK